MRPIHLARLDKSRPVLILTRELVRPHMNTVTVAPIRTTIRGLSSEIAVWTAFNVTHGRPARQAGMGIGSAKKMGWGRRTRRFIPDESVSKRAEGSSPTRSMACSICG